MKVEKIIPTNNCSKCNSICWLTVFELFPENSEDFDYLPKGNLQPHQNSREILVIILGKGIVYSPMQPFGGVDITAS